MTEKVDITLLKPFSKNPFRKLNDEKLTQLAESISQCGLITPILARPIDDPDYRYEIIAGHNRVDATALNGESVIEADIRDLSDELATIMLVDSNLQQRENILPSEKAWAYRAKLEALKSQGKRNDLTCAQFGHKLDGKKSIAVLEENSDDSRNQIKRYIRLTYLIKPLLDLVDDGKLKLNAAVELSYLDESKQVDVFERMEFHDCYNISLESAKRIKEIAKYGELTIDKIDRQCFDKEETPKESIKISANRINSFFDSKTSPKEKEDIIVKALEMYYKQRTRALHREVRENALEGRS